MKDGELVSIQPRANSVCVSRHGDWFVILDVSAGTRIRVHKTSLKDLWEAVYSAMSETRKEDRDA
mgnify:CR=1 FL=1